MNLLVGLLVIVLIALAVIGIFVGLERWLRRPGLAFLLAGISVMLAAVLGLSDGKRLLPVLFLLQAPGFFYASHLRHTKARVERAGPPEA